MRSICVGRELIGCLMVGSCSLHFIIEFKKKNCSTQNSTLENTHYHIHSTSHTHSLYYHDGVLINRIKYSLFSPFAAAVGSIEFYFGLMN